MPLLPDGGLYPQAESQPEQIGFEERLGRILSDARAAIEENGVTAQEQLLLEQLTTLVAKIRANREKEQQAALGGGPATNFLRRASGGQ